MEFTELGNQNGKTLMLLPGTACKWQFNFKCVLEELAQKYHIIAVNYDGFEGDNTRIFPDMLTVTEKIENYILEKHSGRVDGAYGSSLGGSFVGLLVQRKRIHIDHAFIGSSDLDQGSKLTARLLTMLVAPTFSGACRSEAKREKLKARMQKKCSAEDGDKSVEFTNAFIDNMEYVHPKSITRQFYSDYITPLENDISVDGTTVHIIYAKLMGEKYYARYTKHFRSPDIHTFDMKHEVWLYDETWRKPVLDCVCSCMEE